jgi:hypothetical protein
MINEPVQDDDTRSDDAPVSPDSHVTLPDGQVMNVHPANLAAAKDALAAQHAVERALANSDTDDDSASIDPEDFRSIPLSEHSSSEDAPDDTK